MKRLSLILLAVTVLSAAPVASAQEAARPAADLPVTRVVLFSSGVGYFERAGDVDAGSRIEMMFKTEDINDILKSMVIMGAQEASVNYGSQDPVTKALKSFAVDITDNPTMGQLLDQLRGARVRVKVPQMSEGVILGVESRTKIVDEETVRVDVLNVLSADGLQGFELPTVRSIELLDADLQKELSRALAVLAGARDKNKKPVSIAIGGQGRQNVAVGYVVETPVWKTSYRLVLDEAAEKPFLQGWAIVENTTDFDWKDVRLSLVSGQPISFVQDLYTPLYVARQVVKPELYATLQAKAYEGEMARPSDEAFDGAPPPMAMRARSLTAAKKGAGYAYAGADKNDRASNRLGIMEQLKSAAAEAKAVAELFEYPIAGKSSLERQKSAMFPIVSGPVEAERLSIFDPETHDKFPLNGLEITNSTALYLMQGPITVFDGNIYAGDARITDIPVGDKRLISYSLDQKREVAVDIPNHRPELVSLKIVRGVLIVTRKYRRERIYTVNNKDAKARPVLIQYPHDASWDLVEPKGIKPATPTMYRFRVEVPSKKGDRNGAEVLKVVEEQAIDQQIYLSNETPRTIAVYMKSNKASPEIVAALQRIIDEKNKVADLQRQVNDKTKDIAEIERDQQRTRENMRVLEKNSSMYATYLEKWSGQEKKIEELRSEIKTLQAEIEKIQGPMNKMIINLSM